MWDLTSVLEEESGPNLMSEGEDVIGLDAKMDFLYSFLNIKLNCIQHLVQDKSSAVSWSCRQLNKTVFYSS